MEGFLCQRVLAMQEFDFIIKYSKGCHNSNADALLQSTSFPPVVAATQFVTDTIKKNIQKAKLADPTL